MSPRAPLFSPPSSHFYLVAPFLGTAILRVVLILPGPSMTSEIIHVPPLPREHKGSPAASFLEQQFLKLCTQGYELCPQTLPPTSLVPGCCRTTPGGAIHTAMSVNVPGMCEVWLTQTQGPLGRAD